MYKANLILDFIENEAVGEITIFLTNGVKLKGSIESHGDNELTLTSSGNIQLVIYSAIATILKDGRDDNN